MKAIGHQNLNLPRFAPVMVLPQAMLFPVTMLPLYIFESRYRAMLQWSLEHDRMFCVAPMKPGVSEASDVEDFHHTVGLGLVRACRGHENGTSHLVLQGLARVRLASFVQQTPFRIAEVRELSSAPVEAGEVEGVREQLLEICARIRPDTEVALQEVVDRQHASIDDPAHLADIIAHTFLRDSERRQEVFEELNVGMRMRLLLRHLESEQAEASE